MNRTRRNRVLNFVEAECNKQLPKKMLREERMTRDGVENLTLVAELTGHEGCVNCLEWNDKGTILASSSDDTSVILWNVFQRKKIASFKSGHTANVFSVNFLPFTNDNLIATCAADAGVRVWDTNAQASIYSKTSHIGRAKRIATAKDSSNVFWSAGEDGLVLQHDLRDPSPNPLHRVVLLSLISHSSNCECKCIYSNPTRPNYLAIGASDSYARVYDRRMLSPKNVVLPETFETTASWQRFNRFSSYFRNQDDFPLQKGCVRYFTPGHLPIFADDLERKHRGVGATFISFDESGQKLLVNLGSENIYIFDFNDSSDEPIYKRFFPPSSAHRPEMLSNMNMLDVHRMSKRNGSFMKSEALRLEANNFFHERNYFSAIELYNKALHLTPYSHVLWANKSAALMRQRHDGDIYEALRCAYRSFCLHEGEKSCFRIMRNLMDFRRYEQVQEWLEYVKITPFANSMFESPSVRKLMEELEKAKQHPPISNGKFVNIHNYHLSQVEKDLRNHAYDYKIRFAGHCNTTTDIKEAVFVGGRWGKPEFVAAGSDDGSIFIWDTDTTNIVRVLKGDSSIVNCIAPHVEMPILATSGIDNVVRIWEPRRSAKSDKNASEARRGRRASSDAIGQEVTNIPNAAETNAQRMARDPLDQVFLQFQGERDDNQPPIVNCRSQ